MSRDGNGNYMLPAGNPVVTGSVISSSVQNNTMNDIAAALTASMTRDGQGVPTANIPMGGFKITNLAKGTNTAAPLADAINLLQAGMYSGYGTQSGTAAIPITALNQIYEVTPISVSASGAIPVSGLVQTGSKIHIVNTGNVAFTVFPGAGDSFRYNQTTVASFNINPNEDLVIAYNGTTQLNLMGGSAAASGRLLNIQTFATAGTFTYTPTGGTRRQKVTVVGGGGAGGGAASTGASQVSQGSGGGGGAVAISWITNSITQSVVVGAGGTASGGAGTNGGSSSFGAFLSATGGGGGIAGVASAGAVATTATAGGTATGGNIVNVRGGYASAIFSSFAAVAAAVGGTGGTSILGTPGAVSYSATTGTGQPGVTGAGGSGASSCNGSAQTGGGAGGIGLVIIEEYL